MITLAVKIDWPLLSVVLLASCVLAWMLIAAVNASAEAAKKAKESPASVSAARPGDLRAGLGLILIVLSLAFGAYTWLTFETTVETAMGKQVINLGLQHAQTLRLGGSALGVLCGVILAAVRR